MSTVNEHFTISYSQPEEYRFSHDSVFLARRVFEYIRSGAVKPPRYLLDLCAGCGIIGLDLLLHLERENITLPEAADFTDVQAVYLEHWKRNVAELQPLLKKSPALEYQTANYSELQAARPYDLIVCNPPYFRTGHGRLSPSDFKNRCRFFIDAGFGDLLQSLERNLSPQGSAYVLLRPLEEHGVSLEEEIRISAVKLTYQIQAPIRGTSLYKFSLKP